MAKYHLRITLSLLIWSILCSPTAIAEEVRQDSCMSYTFDARGSYDIEGQELTYEWDLGDGTVTQEPFVHHVYKKPGDYKVLLKVYDSSGLQCNFGDSSKEIRVGKGPLADFDIPPVVCENDIVNLKAKKPSNETYRPMLYKWEFGDQSGGDLQETSVSFSRGGVYPIKLSVTDPTINKCAESSSIKQLRVNRPPIANAGRDITVCAQSHAPEGFDVPFDGSGSHDPDRNDILSYHWNFGDGSKSNEMSGTHHYNKEGSYMATLTVKDPYGTSCSTSQDTRSVLLARKPSVDAGQDKKICLGQVVRLNSINPSDHAVYMWDMGDGNLLKGPSIEHRYQQGGAYNVTITADDGRNLRCSTNSDSLLVYVNTPPSIEPLQGIDTCTGRTITFNTNIHDIDRDRLDITWDFGDGVIKKGSNRISHTYQKSGSYQVKVFVDDGSNTPCARAESSTTVKVNSTPIANPGPNLACCVGQQVQFDGSKSFDTDGETLTYVWDLGDGTIKSGQKIDHIYKNNGNYPVTLTVSDGSDSKCGTNSAGFTATVNAKPVPIIRIE